MKAANFQNSWQLFDVELVFAGAQEADGQGGQNS